LAEAFSVLGLGYVGTVPVFEMVIIQELACRGERMGCSLAVGLGQSVEGCDCDFNQAGQPL
jgi:hypothetical protein